MGEAFGASRGRPTSAWTFFRQWLRNPRAMASVVPSSRALARCMVAQLPPDANQVVELGAGTGVFTRALLERGIAPSRLLVVELNPALAAELRVRFPGVRVVQGDACDLARIAGEQGFAAHSIDAVISGLGFLAMPPALQRAITRAVFDVLGPGRELIQFTYSPKSPLPEPLLDELGLQSQRACFTAFNLPPATVFRFRRTSD